MEIKMIYKDLKSNQPSSFSEVQVVSEIDAIKNSIKNILTTQIGSVPGRPNFGSNLHLIVFEQMDALTEKIAERYTKEALAKFEDRINILDVSVSKNEAFNRLTIDIRFSFRDNIGRTQIDSTSIPFNL